MPQTKNFGFPLMADTPPEGATGKDLRDAIIGEGTGSLASMVDAELQKVKNSVPLVNQNITLTWDGNTSGLTAASGQLTYTIASHATKYSFYKISNTLVLSDIVYRWGYSYGRSLKKINDYVYSFAQDSISDYFAFSVLSANQSITVNETYWSGTVTFPQRGFYVYKISSSNYCDYVSTRNSVYNKELMGSLAAETTNNKVQAINENSTHDKYPTAKAVWNALANAGDSGGISGVKVNGAALEAENGEVDITVPAKVSQLENDSGYLTGAALVGKEDVSNRLETYNGVDGNWSDAASTNYPSSAAVRDFVADYVSTHSNFSFIYEFLIQPEMNTVELDTAVWDGSTEGVVNFLGMFYKTGECTALPDVFKVELSEKESDGTVSGPIDVFETGFPYLFTNSKITDLKEAFGIVIYSLDLGDDVQPLVVASDRSGILPADVIEMIMGTNPGADIPYESGVFALYRDGLFVSKAVSCMTVKNYIDRRLNETGGGA